MKTLLAALLLLLPVGARAQDSVLLRAEVSPKEILIGDPVTMNISVVYSTGITPAPVEFPKIAGEIEIASAESLPPRAKGDRMEATHKLVLTTFSTGPVTIPALSLYFKNPDGSLSEAKTDVISITVKSLLAEKGDEGNLRPLKGLFNFRPLWPIWLLIGLFLLGVAMWLFLKYRATRIAPVPAGPPPPIYSPEEEAERALAALEQSTLVAEGQYKDFYSALSSILRRYAGRRFDLSAQEMTSSELLQAFRRSRVPSEAMQISRAFLDNADLVKFAKWTPEAEEIAADVARVRAFIDATTEKPSAPEPEPEAEAETREDADGEAEHEEAAPL